MKELTKATIKSLIRTLSPYAVLVMALWIPNKYDVLFIKIYISIILLIVGFALWTISEALDQVRWLLDNEVEKKKEDR